MNFQKAPELRFSEFKSNWLSSNFGKYIEERVEYPDENLPLYSLTIEGGIVPKTERYERSHLVKSDSKSYKLVKPFDFAFNPMNLRFGALAMHKELKNVIVSKYYNIFYFNNKCIPRFFEYYLTTHKMIQFYEKMATGTLEEKKRVHFSDFINFKKPIPSKKEQQKIANFLSSVDQKIQHLRRNKELLENYKQGVMQKIFSQELRFKDENGEGFPDWEYKELGDISDRMTDKNEDEEYDFVLTNSAIEGVVSQTDYFDKSIANKNNLGGYYIIKKDDFVYNPRISNEAPVGPIKRNKIKKGIMSPLYTIFRIKEKNLDFFEYFFETTLWHRYMQSVANIGARHDRMNITVSDFQKLPVPVPSEEEREKIVNFINSVSEKLQTINRKLELVQKFKKGLLQQMFV